MIRDVERRGEVLIVGFIGRFFCFGAFEFALGYETFLLGADAVEKDGCRFVIGVLWQEFTTDGEVEYALA